MRLTRVTLFFIAFIITLGFCQLALYFLSGVEQQTFQGTEEVMVDVSQLFAEMVGQEMENGGFDAARLKEAFEGAHARTFRAQIFNHLKQRIGLNVYVTDAAGVVVFDSNAGKREGQDLSTMLDVSRTLAGSYGARSSRDEEAEIQSSIMYVAAPIGDPARPDGVLTVYKPQLDMVPIIQERRKIIYSACILIGGGILFLLACVFLWLFRPIGKITEYARAIERGERPAKPKIGIGREVNTLAHALDSMRDALEGRQYVQRYVETLTHEMKSPLAAIRGAAELLDEDMPLESRRRFLENIRAESSRTERLINRLLELSAIESLSHLDRPEETDFRGTVDRAIEQALPLAEVAGVNLSAPAPGPPLPVRGNAFVLRAAVSNLLENAIDFSPRGGEVRMELQWGDGSVALRIGDQGPGIPEYAREKVFERFFSLRHHSAGRKGTGLGLTLVKEAAELHGGSITLSPAAGRGTQALLVLPLG